MLELPGTVSLLEVVRTLVILAGIGIHAWAFVSSWRKPLTRRRSIKVAGRRDRRNQIGLLVIQVLFLLQVGVVLRLASPQSFAGVTGNLSYIACSLILSFLTVAGRSDRLRIAKLRREEYSRAIPES